jgi:hypothetical protein
MSTQEATTAKTKRSESKKAEAKAKSKPGKATKPGAKPKAAKTKEAKGAARSGSKTEIVLTLMRRKEGATLGEIAKATDWQNHSIRGFVSGHVIKKLGLKVESTKSEAGERTYRVVS